MAGPRTPTVRRRPVVRAVLRRGRDGLRSLEQAALRPLVHTALHPLVHTALHPLVHTALGRVQGSRVARRRALVERFTPEELQGWVELPDGQPVRVSLHVGETEVMATWTSDRAPRDPTESVRAFSLATRQLWPYCSRRDRVSVRIDGTPVPIVGHGLWLEPAADGERGLDELRRELAAGKVFNRGGRLQVAKGLDTDWQRRVLALYARTREVLAAERGLDVFLLYGTLLGAVREGGFLGHDNDFDAGYVSRHTEPQEAARELQQIGLLLVEHGLHVDCRRSLLHIHDAEDRRVRIDLFHLLFDAGGTMRFAFGAAGTERMRRADWQGVCETDLGGAPVLVPVVAEQFVEVLYGSEWRRPVPGFSWTRERRQVTPAARLPLAWRQEVHWADFHARHDAPAASSFAAHVLRRADLPADVVDLGCGQGGDALALAAAGSRVTGVDRAPEALRKAVVRAAERGLTDRVRWVAADLGDADALGRVLDEARARAAGGPLLLYARSLLHAVSEEVQEVLLTVLRDRARPGDLLAAEFRTLADEPRRKVHAHPHRRFLDGPAVVRRLAEVFGEVVEEQAGTGWSPYGDEDPVLHRVLARRT